MVEYEVEVFDWVCEFHHNIRISTRDDGNSVHSIQSSIQGVLQRINLTIVGWVPTKLPRVRAIETVFVSRHTVVRSSEARIPHHTSVIPVDYFDSINAWVTFGGMSFY